jgi:hypothetical protein
MAGIQKSQDIDTLSVRKIYAKGDNNTTLAANSVLITDGKGGTLWLDISTFQRGVTFNTFETTQSTFTSGPNSSKFSILDGLNAGLIPASGNSATVYAKAFGQINVEGQDSIYSFDTYTGTINSNVQIVGSGVVEITTVSSMNKIEFYSPDNGTSSMSTVLANFVGLNNGLSNKIAAFNSPFSTFIYDAISSYSTVQGPLVTFPEMYSTISSFSTSMGPVVTGLNLLSSLSTNNTVAQLNIGNLNVSTFNVLGSRQPYIQYGSNILASNGNMILSLPTPYVNSNYIVQLTYYQLDTTLPNIRPLYSSNTSVSNVAIYGTANSIFHWTTFGNLF